MFQRTTRAAVGVLGLVLITVSVGDFGQAATKVPPSRTQSRWRDLLNGWVLDRTTGLMWQKSPGGGSMPADTASTYCTNLGGGARLPEIKELYSLVDYSAAYPGPFLPVDHKFLNVQSALFYWSATQLAGFPGQGFYVDFSNGRVFGAVTSTNGNVWCVS